MQGLINALIDLIQIQGSALLILAVCLYVAFWGVFKITQFTTTWNIRNDDIKELRKDWNRDIPYLKQRIQILYEATERSTVKTRSPLSFTDIGTKIAKELNAEDICQKHKSELITLVNKTKPLNAYDLQQSCVLVVEAHLADMLDEATLSKAKQIALKHGAPPDNVLAVVAVLLRDGLMKDGEWPSSDIEQHEPNTINCD